MSSNTAEPLTKNVGTGNITFSISDHLPPCLVFFLIIIPTGEMMKHMTGADLMRTHFQKILILKIGILSWKLRKMMLIYILTIIYLK